MRAFGFENAFYLEVARRAATVGRREDSAAAQAATECLEVAAAEAEGEDFVEEAYSLHGGCTCLPLCVMVRAVRGLDVLGSEPVVSRAGPQDSAAAWAGSEEARVAQRQRSAAHSSRRRRRRGRWRRTW